MSIRVPSTIAVPTEVAASVPVDVAEYETFTIYVSGTFVMTAALEVSPDSLAVSPGASEWVVAEAGLAAGQFIVPDHCMKARVNVTAFTSGAMILKVVGQRV